MRYAIVALILIAAASFCILPGCLTPPRGTVWIDTDGNLLADALAVDADFDGKPDLDASGNIMLVATGIKPSTVEGAERVDELGPMIMGAAGSLLAGPIPWLAAILAGVGAVWKGSKFGRIFLNTVVSVQAARAALAKNGYTVALSIVDDVLRTQMPETVKAIDKAKEAAGLDSVTDYLSAPLSDSPA